MSRDGLRLRILVLLLLATGLVVLFSASAVAAEHSRRLGDAYHYLKRQLLWGALAVGAFVTAARIPLAFWRRARTPMFGATLLLLLLVSVPGIGTEGLYGARRWLRVGGFFVQPSEIAKIALLLYLCGRAADDPVGIRTFRRGFMPAFGAILLVCALVAVEPDVGTAAFLGLVGVAALFVAGARPTHLVPAGAAAAAGALLVAVTRMQHVRARLEAWWHPDAHDAGYQLKQSLVALGSGGWLGEGLGRGVQKLNFLPEVHSDFIFAVIGEELGWFGTVAILVLFAGFAWVGARIARSAPNRFGGLLAISLTFSIALQAAFNVAVVTGLLPTKGIPLPFLSYGGSSLLVTMSAAGILARVAEESAAEARPGPAENPGLPVPATAAP